MNKNFGMYVAGSFFVVLGGLRIWWDGGWSLTGVSSFGLLLLLVLLAISDIQTMYLQSHILMTGAGVGLMLLIADPQINLAERLITAFLTLILVMGIGRFSRDSIGLGDGFVLALIGLYTGWRLLMVTAAAGLLLAACIGLVLMVVKGRKGQMKMPFVPFLMGVYWLWLVL